MSQTMHTKVLLDKARAWIEADPDSETRNELQKIVDQLSQSEDEELKATLESRFSGPLTFGTAGLRGPIAAGESCMNTAVVIRATAGLMAYLKEKMDSPRVVIGCDARHGSNKFYKAAAEVISAAGGEALQLPPELPTPLTAFAVRELNADAGIMITASHNPPADNGYKVYLGGRAVDEDGRGRQIIPPADKEIADHIETAPMANEIARDQKHIQAVDVREEYLRAATDSYPEPAVPLKIVLTPMHGVGGELAKEAFTRAGFTDVTLVPSQAQPDPDFPTVAFPNPEEPGAMDEALAVAVDINADLIIALDPDADRCAVSIPLLDQDKKQTGKYLQLSGDQTGILLGDYLANAWRTQGQKGKAAMAASIVSSRMLGKIAEAYGMEFVTTLTGFKWIARAPHMIFGYEEAIGFCTAPQYVTDKDGITAGLSVARMAARLKSRASNLLKRLHELYREHGCYITAPLTFRVEDLAVISKAMAKLQDEPPKELAGSKVDQVVDLSKGYEGLPPTTGIMLLTENQDRVIVRPSGTEPKLKCYLEVIQPAPADKPLPVEEAQQRIELIKADLKSLIGL